MMKPLVYLSLKNKKNTTIPIYALTLSPSQYSSHYTAKITLFFHQAIHPKKWVAQLGSLTANKALYPIIIKQCQYNGLSHINDQHQYTLIATSPLLVLTYRKNTKIFRKKTLKNIIESIISPITYIKIQWNTTRNLSIIPISVQYNESDLAFLHRILTEQQCIYFFSNHSNYELIITDIQQLHQTSISQPISYHPLSTTPVNTETLLYIHNTQYSNSTINQNHYTAITHNSNLTPGQHIILSDHPIAEFNQSYVILHARIHYQQSIHPLTSTLTLISTTQHFTLTASPQQFYHLLPAKIINKNTSNDSAVNQHGLYAIQYGFEHRPDPTSLQQSIQRIHPFACKQQPNQAGIHFPLSANTWVMVQLIDGDFNQPIIIGALHSKSRPSAITRNHATQNIIESNQGHQLFIDQNTKHPKMVFSTKNNAQYIHFSQLQNTPTIMISNTSGNIRTNSQQNIAIYCNQHQMHSKQHRIYSKKNHTTLTQQGNIIITSGNNHTASAKKNVYLQSQRQSIHFSTKKTWHIHAEQSIHLSSEQSSGTLTLKTNTAHWQACHTLHGHSKHIYCQTAGGSITINSHNLHINAKCLSLNAPIINVYGVTG